MRRQFHTTPNAWPVCAKCGSAEHLDRHHVYAREHGGVDDPWNLAWLCRDCHLTWHELRRSRALRGKGHRHAHQVFNTWLRPRRVQRSTVTAV